MKLHSIPEQLFDGLAWYPQPMNRMELLQLVIGRARANGFAFRRWYKESLGLPWISAEAATTLLESQRRYYALIFSHDFARAFWKAGEDITFKIPSQSFPRRMPDGSIRIVQRKSYIRRSARPDVWRYHLQQMAISEDPLRYLRRYLHLDAELEPDATAIPGPGEKGPSAKRSRKAAATSAPTKPVSGRRGPPRPLPTEMPAFLKRPYQGSAPS